MVLREPMVGRYAGFDGEKRKQTFERSHVQG